jgi:dihydroxyacetone kinase-like protein
MSGEGDGAAASDGAAVVAAVEAVAERIESERTHLTDLDSAIGDADHGGNMARGWAAAAEAARDLDDPDPQSVCKTVGKTLMSEVGGASGPLFGGSLVFASAELDGGVTPESAVAFAETYLEKVEDRGDARVGDQTMVDALTPAVHTFKKSIETDGLPALEALAKAVDAAERGVAFTVPIRARKGRASYLGWRSVGHQDPGATSTLFILEELLATAADRLDTEVPDVDATSPTIPDEAAAEDD